MPGCVFRVSGDEVAINEYLASTLLVPYRIWHAGDVRNHRRLVCKDSGFCVDVSSVDGNLQEQIPDAIEFLRRNQTELMRLSAFSGIGDKRLDFGYVRRDVAVQYDYLPPELLSESGALGIGTGLSLYPASD